MKRLLGVLVLAVSAACSSSGGTEPLKASRVYSNEAVTAADPLWTASGNGYSQIRIRLIEQPDTHTLYGQWGGDRADCTTPAAYQPCRDTGIVVGGTGYRSGNGISFAVTSLNGTRSVWFDGTIAADSSMSGQSYIFENGSSGPRVSLSLRRSP